MKFPFYIIIFAIFLLAACGPAATTLSSPIPDTATPTKKPTDIPAGPNSPTATLEPSPTVDPNIPDGSTGNDGLGYYRDTIINGVPVRERQALDDQGNELVPGWFGSRNRGGQNIFFIGHEENYMGFDAIPVQFNFQDGPILNQSNIYISHGDATYTDLDRQGNVFSALVMSDLGERYAGKDDPTNLKKNPTDVEWNDYFAALKYNSLKISFINLDGATKIWEPAKGVDVNVVDKKTVDVTDGTWFDITYNSQVHIYSKVTVNVIHKLITVVTSDVPIDSLPPMELRKMLLFGAVHVMRYADMSMKYYHTHFLTNFSDFTAYFTLAGKGPPSNPSKNPYIDIVPGP